MTQTGQILQIQQGHPNKRMAYIGNPNQRVMVQQPMRNQRTVQNQPVVMQTNKQNVVQLQSTVQQQSIPHQVKVNF